MGWALYALVGLARFRVGSVRLCIRSTRLFGNQDVGISNAKKRLVLGSCVGLEPQIELFRIAVEYRLKGSYFNQTKGGLGSRAFIHIVLKPPAWEEPPKDECQKRALILVQLQLTF